jgi:hypothetical protein
MVHCGCGFVVVGTCRHSRSWLGLEGYTVVNNLLAYPGRAGVFTVPTTITHEGLVGLAAVENPSFVGYIAEGTGLSVCLTLLLVPTTQLSSGTHVAS